MLGIDNPRVMVSALKRAQDQEGYLLRLYEGSGRPAEATLSLLDGAYEYPVHLDGFEIKTWLWNPETGRLTETSLIEA